MREKRFKIFVFNGAVSKRTNLGLTPKPNYQISSISDINRHKEGLT
jgi:hypothetical protein